VIATSDRATFRFEIDPFRRKRLLGGLDDIAVTTMHESAIQAYEHARRAQEPWLFVDDTALSKQSRA
jgi:3-isopropylmalate/(R)-2-methylmalate dehydratase small subunit